MKWIIMCLVLSACAWDITPTAGCAAYGELRTSMPRPLEATALGQWVAVADTRMTATCR